MPPTTSRKMSFFSSEIERQESSNEEKKPRLKTGAQWTFRRKSV
jgi:hypothetical protein